MTNEAGRRDEKTRDERLGDYFTASDRERAIFEAGIKLGGIFHQFVGTPLSLSNREALERAIEESVKVQPYVCSARVRIRRLGLHKKEEEFDYGTLQGEDLQVELVLRYRGVRVVAVMEYIEEEDYPLMYIREITGD